MMNNAKDLYLFDIDGTLVNINELHATAYQNAYKKVFGREVSKKKIISKFGMTEIAVHESICKEENIQYSDNQIQEIINLWYSEAMKCLETYSLQPLPGVCDLLKQLIKNPNNLLGIITGNFKEMGRKVLQASNILSFFSFFSWGSDEIKNRKTLVLNAIKQAEPQGYQEGKSKLTVIGDSPWDIKAGNYFGAYTVGVLTGSRSREELSEADLILDDLTQFKMHLLSDIL